MPKNSNKILIIEDEKLLSKALDLKLKHEGFDVSVIPSGENIISILKSDNFSLLICDLMMPKVDGFDILNILKEEKIDIPVIILTNLSQPEDEKKVMDLGANKFFIKSDTPLSSVVDYIKTLKVSK